MSRFIWIFGLLAVSHQTGGSSNNSVLPRFYQDTFDSNCTNIFGPKCNDCTTLLTCLGEGKPYQIQNCERIYPGQPYCVDGACSSSPDPNNVECTTVGNICTGTGYFPNPINCSQYFFCRKPLAASVLYECPSGFVYNSQTKLCHRQTVPADCSITNCASNPYRYVAYDADPSYYALCMVTDGISAPIMFKCPDSEQFIPSQRRCVHQCQEVGRSADPKDCTKFYECYNNGLNFIMIHQSCLPGFIFSREERICVEDFSVQ